MAVAALVIMIVVALGDPLRVVAASIFGATLVLLYGASTIYHAHSCPRMKPFLQIIDHACIYLLIAGSYTPLTLVTLRGAWGWTLFGIVWFLAIVGVAVKACMRGKRESWWSTALYLGMGWLAVIAIRPLLAALPPAGLAWLVAGGLCYSFGVFFFIREKMRFNHAIWHLFVIAGSACHVVATTVYMLR
jgi:hemolysin III